MVIEAVFFYEWRTMPLAIRFDDWMGIQDKCFSIPVVVGAVVLFVICIPK